MSKKSIELPESYQKARKVFIFVSALLLLWEFVGITIDGVNSEGLNITFQSPEAIPIVLLITVFYFGFRLLLEWKYLSNEMKENQYVKVDFYSSNLLGLLGLFIYSYQVHFGNQFYEFFDIYFIEITLSISFIAAIYVMLQEVRSEYFKNKTFRKYLILYALYIFSLFIIAFLFFKNAFFSMVLFPLLILVIPLNLLRHIRYKL